MAASSSSTPPIPVHQQQQQDRIGALPDPLLLHILSFIPTLDAVCTSVLSTRWRTLWTSVGALDLDEDNDFFSSAGRKSRGSFIEFVCKVLSFHHTPTLHKLRLNCCCPNRPLKDWISTAVSRGIQMLDLCLPQYTGWFRMVVSRGVQLPPLLFTSQSLVDLRLDLGGSSLILSGTLAFVGLRRMRLCRVQFSDDHSTRALFSNSTTLRSLALENCDYQKLGCLEIACSSLQELAIEDGSSLEEDGLGSCQVKIVAPQLSSFVYCASVAQSYVVEPLFPVEYVKIQFEHFKVWKGLVDKPSILDRASSFLCSLSSARNLDMSSVRRGSAV